MLTKVRNWVSRRALPFVRLACLMAVALLGFAGEIFAQSSGQNGNNGESFDNFPKFFDLSSLVTTGVSYLAAAAVIIVGAVVAWRITMKLVNMFIRRVG